MLSDVRALLPETLLLATALVVLVAGSFSPRQRQWPARALSAAGLVAAAVVAAVDLAGPARAAFEGSFAVDTTTGAARLIAALATLLVVLLAGDEVRGHARESELHVLLLLGTDGVLLMAGATDLLLLVVAFLLASIPLYGLIGVVSVRGSAEAALKTYLMGALSGILLMLGVTVLYGLTAQTSYAGVGAALDGAPATAAAAGFVLVLVGLMFKAGGVPMHFWVPDAAEGSSAAAAAFLTTVPKVGAVVAAYRLLDDLAGSAAWGWLVAVLAVASMTLGNLAAYPQRDPRRLLGWSTVSQVGYALVPVAVAGQSPLALPSLLVFLAAYAATNIGAFAVVAALPDRRRLADYRGLSRSWPALAGALVVVLLGLVGTPPTAVFVGKLTTATAAWDGGMAWLAVAVLANTLLSLFYYLRWIIPAFRLDPALDGPVGPGDEQLGTPARWAATTAVLAAGVSLAVGLGAGAVWAAFSA